jgi:hypothetical protein
MKCLDSIVKSLIILFPFACSPDLMSQVADDFSDGNFTSNPSWQGDTGQFQITNSSAIPPEMKPALQLFAEGSDTAFLSLPNSMMMNNEWRFWIKLSFNTSANNFARVYLVSDQSNLEGPLNGYFVQAGGNEDSIALFKQSGLELEKIIAGSVAFTGNSSNVLRIKVIHDTENNWTLYSAGDGGFNYAVEGVSGDDTFTSTGFFGLSCKYTSSNSTKFYFDDFYVNEIVIDTIPPEINTLQVISETQLDLSLSEPVEINSAQNVLNYSVNTIGNPSTATRDPIDFSVVNLMFQQNFTAGTNYTLTVNDVADLSGNLMENVTVGFQLETSSLINPFDIVINEIMTDVNPLPAGLPEADYLELYNRTSSALNLKNCTIKPRESADPIVFPNVLIQPDSFLIVVQTSDVPDFEQYGAVVGLPGFTMNNEGTVVLRNPDGTLLSFVSYTSEWYNDADKMEGGWDLEQIDPQHPCSGKVNWTASVESSGGTPGRQNSVDAVNFYNPEILSAEISGTNTVSISFSHIMDSLSLIKPLAYSVDQGMGFPNEVQVNGDQFNSVTLIFESDFLENEMYQLTITDTLYNCSGDFIALNSVYPLIMPAVAEMYDVVINEIMADPDPPVGLVEYEYLEIFNTTTSYLRMNNWTLQVGTTDKSIPSIIIEPNEFILFTENEAVNLYGMLARSFGFSSLGLSNTGTTLKLINDQGTVISSVAYRDSWYNDADKGEGGWSLEQIDPLNPCPGKDNWTVSMDDRGGSPGIQNSVYAQNPVEPIVTKVISVDKNTLEVYFNQLMDETTILNADAYSVDRGIGHPVQVSPGNQDMNMVVAEFSESLEVRILYTLTVTDDVQSCIGQPVPAGFEITFGIPEDAETNDVVINEVLFDPADDGVDFVEIYNRSEKIIDIKDLKLGTIEINQFEPNDTVFKSVTDENALLLSGSYVALTIDPVKVQEQYITENPGGFVSMSSFPAYNNDAGAVILSSSSNIVIDAFNYDEGMHYPLLNSLDGVSLERINYDRPSQDNTNWHSASEDCGFATPAYKNSQYSESTEVNDEVTIEPEIFSPDNDGLDDVANINYKFDVPGYSCSITVYDAQGRLVNQLVNNELLGAEGTFSWDGRSDANQKAVIGIYIIYIEAFDLTGKVKRYKKPVVLAGKL